MSGVTEHNSARCKLGAERKLQAEPSFPDKVVAFPDRTKAARVEIRMDPAAAIVRRRPTGLGDQRSCTPVLTY
jgi:hypothetical protein